MFESYDYAVDAAGEAAFKHAKSLGLTGQDACAWVNANWRDFMRSHGTRTVNRPSEHQLLDADYRAAVIIRKGIR